MDVWEEKASHEEAFQLNLRAAARGLWSGALDYFDFLSLMQSAVRRAFTQAWETGMRSVGIEPEEYTPEERTRLEVEIYKEYEYIDKFASAIEAGSKSAHGKLTPQLQRADLWTKAYGRIYQLARLVGSRDKKLVWRMGATIEHCADCRYYEGKVYRASVWKKYDIRPRTWELDCHGINCLCTLEPTDERVTPGFPRKPSGG